MGFEAHTFIQESSMAGRTSKMNFFKASAKLPSLTPATPTKFSLLIGHSIFTYYRQKQKNRGPFRTSIKMEESLWP